MSSFAFFVFYYPPILFPYFWQFAIFLLLYVYIFFYVHNVSNKNRTYPRSVRRVSVILHYSTGEQTTDKTRAPRPWHRDIAASFPCSKDIGSNELYPPPGPPLGGRQTLWPYREHSGERAAAGALCSLAAQLSSPYSLPLFHFSETEKRLLCGKLYAENN
jgi:hypothetical protein